MHLLLLNDTLAVCPYPSVNLFSPALSFFGIGKIGETPGNNSKCTVPSSEQFNKPNKVIVLIGSKVQGDRPYKDDRPTKYTIGSAD